MMMKMMMMMMNMKLLMMIDYLLHPWTMKLLMRMMID
jgi:hypothetical protein